MTASGPPRIPWNPIAALGADDVLENGGLAALEALRLAWEDFQRALTDDERIQIRQRSLRRLAIETGMLERLYDIDWGLTLTLVAEGFTRDVIERAGGNVDERTRATLEGQRDSLQMVLEFVSSGRDLSSAFIKELHAAITRTQQTYAATDGLGRSVEVSLQHGEFKSEPNHVQLKDGRVLEYAPPEHVASEIDRLVELHAANELNGVHPIVSAAWLHHRFVQIHPFSDGNGRVARALVLLVLTKHRFAPLVVDRFHRESYLDALDAANDGRLTPLVRLFTRLESSALTSELESPSPKGTEAFSSQVAHTLAQQLRAARERKRTQLQRELRPRALSVAARVRQWFESKEAELRKLFREQTLDDVLISSDFEVGPDATRRYWFRHQIIDAAHRAGHYAEFGPDSGWCGIRIKIGGLQLRYVAALHGAGQDSGVFAVVTFGEVDTLETEEMAGGANRQAIDTTSDAFRVVHSESVSSIEERSGELTDLLDEGLTVALMELRRLAR